MALCINALQVTELPDLVELLSSIKSCIQVEVQP